MGGAIRAGYETTSPALVATWRSCAVEVSAIHLRSPVRFILNRGSNRLGRAAAGFAALSWL
jgi:hypothetical protein